MANTKEIQKRMKSISDTMKITNAMYMDLLHKAAACKKHVSRHRAVFLLPAAGIWTNPASCTGDGQYLFQADFGGRFTG